MGRKSGMDAGTRREEHSVVEQAQASAFALEEFRRVASTGAFRRIVLISDWTHFMVRGEFQGGSYANLSKSKKGGLRKFLNPAAALALLRRMGVVRVEVEMYEWDVEMASLSTRMRPDVTARRLHRRRNGYLELLPEAERQKLVGPEGIGKPSRAEERSRLVKGKTMEARIAADDERWRSGQVKEVAKADGKELSDRFLKR